MPSSAIQRTRAGAVVFRFSFAYSKRSFVRKQPSSNPVGVPESQTHMRVQRAAIAALLLASAGCSTSQAPPGAPRFPPAAVKLATASTAPIEDATEYVATLKSLHSTTIQPQIDGQITQIFVKSGDRVAQGAPLVQIDPRRQQAAVSSQEAERAATERRASTTRASSSSARAQLFAAGAISKQEQEQARDGAPDRRGQPQVAAGAGAAAAGAAALLHDHRADRRHRRRHSGPRRQCRSRRRRC